MHRFISVALFGALLAAPAFGYPGGTPGFQTDVAPYCAGCHSSRSEEMLAGLGPRAQKELPGAKHYPKISAGKGGYEALSEADRATLIEHLKAVDDASTVTVEAPASIAAGSTFEVTVSVTGGAGPAVAVALVDGGHRFLARPAPSAGWQVVGVPAISGPAGPQEWLGRRPEALGRNLAFVNVTGIESDAAAGKWASAQVTWTLRAPPASGSYPLGAAYWYGTEKASPLGYTTDPVRGKQVRGSYLGNSGRILISTPVSIEVR